MAGISTTGLGLPAATGTFGTAASTVAPASTQEQPGIAVSGPGGTTTLPAASPADFAGTNPTPLDQPHPDFPQLIQSHVAVLQAAGTPVAVIQQFNDSGKSHEDVERWIQGELFQAPEVWDSMVGNPMGTARAGLTPLVGEALAPAGQGTPGYLPDGSTVSGINVPGLSTPLLDPSTGMPQEQGGGGVLKGALFAAGAVGVGLIGWKFLKNKNAVEEPARLAAQAFAGGAGGAGGGVAGAHGGLNAIQAMGRQLMDAGVHSSDLSMVHRGMSLGVLGGGGAHAAATAESIMHGMGPANGFINSAGISALHFDMPMKQAINAALADRYMGVLELATKSGQLGDFAASQVAMKQALQGGAEAAAGGIASASSNVELRNLLVGAANAIPV